MDSLKLLASSDFWIDGFASIFGSVTNWLTNKFSTQEIGPDWVEVNDFPIALPNLSREFDGYRLVQISDLHLGSWMDGARLARVAEMVNQLKPDLIVITGDFISNDHPELERELISGLSHLHAPDGIAVVLGNHDHRHGFDLVTRAVHTINGEILSNRVISIQRGDHEFWLAGVDSYSEGLADVEKILKQLPVQGTAILLAHEPDFADISAATGRFQLQLSGHTHGGQIILPVLGSLYLPRLGRKYPSGRYQIGDMTLYTNRGIGMIHLLLRVNCLPEIALFRLNAEF